MKMERITIRLTEEHKKFLEKEKQRTGNCYSATIRTALTTYMDEKTGDTV